HSSIRLTRLGEQLSPFQRRSRANHLSRPASLIAVAPIHHLVCALAHLACRFLWNTGSAHHAQDNPPGLSIYAYTPGRGYSWAKIIAGWTVPISLAAGCHDDNDERRRLFKRSAPSY